MIDLAAHWQFLLLTISCLLLWLGCLGAESRIERRFRVLLRIFRNLIIPAFVAMWVVEEGLDYAPGTGTFKTAQTVFGFTLVWWIATAFKVFFFARSPRESMLGRTPDLLVDILRIGLVLIGATILYSSIWQKDVSPLLTTFGVGSLVLGLALQDTLGNLFSGLALVFERPVAVGDWVQLGDTVGRVQQINWRSVRIVTREFTEITIPNSAIGKERIFNFSNPGRLHGFKVNVGFSYTSPPNVVKSILEQTSRETPGIVPHPAPEARTMEFGAYAVQYELRVYIADYDELVAVRNELMSRIWYAAQRHGLNIPYPITTLYKTEVPYVAPGTTKLSTLVDLIQNTELFRQLSSEEAESLAQDIVLERFASGERIIREGDAGDFFFVLVEGRVSVSVRGQDDRQISISDLNAGALFGEMSLLEGSPRAASVFAAGDVTVARIGKDALSKILSRRPQILESFASYVKARAKELDAARALDSKAAHTAHDDGDHSALTDRLRRFFGL